MPSQALAAATTAAREGSEAGAHRTSGETMLVMTGDTEARGVVARFASTAPYPLVASHDGPGAGRAASAAAAAWTDGDAIRPTASPAARLKHCRCVRCRRNIGEAFLVLA